MASPDDDGRRLRHGLGPGGRRPLRAARGRGRSAGWRGLLGLLVLLIVLLAACSGRMPRADRPAAEEIAQLASETVQILDQAVANADEQLQQAAAAASEAAAAGDLRLATPGTLVVGTNADFLPFVGRDEAGTLTGFDVALLDAIATRLGLVSTYTDMPFTSLTGAVTAGEVDVVMAAITVTEARDAVIDFSRPYFVASQSLGARPDTSLTGLADLDAETIVAVLSETTGEAYARENFTEVLIQPFPDRATALGALAAGSADAVFMDTDAVTEQARSGTLVLLEEVPTSERYAIGLREGNAPLRTALNSTLAEIIDDGTYRELFTQWFPARDVDQAISLLR